MYLGKTIGTYKWDNQPEQVYKNRKIDYYDSFAVLSFEPVEMDKSLNSPMQSRSRQQMFKIIIQAGNERRPEAHSHWFIYLQKTRLLDQHLSGGHNDKLKVYLRAKPGANYVHGPALPVTWKKQQVHRWMDIYLSTHTYTSGADPARW